MAVYFSGMLKYSGLAKLHFEEPADVPLVNFMDHEQSLNII